MENMYFWLDAISWSGDDNVGLTLLSALRYLVAHIVKTKQPKYM